MTIYYGNTKVTGTGVQVDTALSTTSEHAVTNKAISNPLIYVTKMAQRNTVKDFCEESMVDASELISATGAVNPIALDLSTNKTLAKLTAKGTSGALAPLSSALVSEWAPFTNATAPQLDVSYSTLDHTDLVNLFNSMPYNVGYTVTGSPTISNGVASGFTASDYLQVSASGMSNADITEIVWKCKLNQSALRQSSNFVMYKYSGGNLQLSIYGGTTTFNAPNLWVPGPNSSYGFTGFTPIADTWFWLKITYDGSTLKLYSSLDGITYTLRRTEESITMTGTDGLFNIGYSYSTGYFDGEIDLNESHIKINGKAWFFGLPTMTKTCSVVGCSGTSSLTNEDKAIVTNKGWSLTIA